MHLKVFAAILLLAGILATGCSRPSSQRPADLISRQKALELSQHAATRHGYRLDKYTLSNFGEELSTDGKEWLFLYQCKPVPAPGCHFLVVVDRTTGATRVVPGE